jgi:hypothetical protein
MVNWWFGVARARENQPEPEAQKRKPQASYTPLVARPQEKPKLYGLTQDCEIYTPHGVVEAVAGDLLLVTDSALWVIPPEKVPIGWALKVE